MSVEDSRASLLAWAASELDGVIEQAKFEAELLLAECENVDRVHILTWPEKTVLSEVSQKYKSWIQRRSAGEPLAYIVGFKEFWSLRLKVSPAVLIPRPETEVLVQWALEIAQLDKTKTLDPCLLDLATGSGAVALALADELPELEVLATDISEDALLIAKENAINLHLDNIEFVRSNWFDAFENPIHGSKVFSKFNLIVSNPPYIAEDDTHLADLKYEPELALSSGADGLNALRTIVEEAPTYLTDGGYLLLEHGYDQGEAVRALLAARGFSQVATRRDDGGNERVSGGKWNRHDG